MSIFGGHASKNNGILKVSLHLMSIVQNREISYKGFLVRIRKDNLVSLSDFWKAEGKLIKFRVGDWIRIYSTQFLPTAPLH